MLLRVIGLLLIAGCEQVWGVDVPDAGSSADAPATTWQLINVAGAKASSVSTLASLTHDLIVVAVQTSNDAVPGRVSDNVGNAYVLVPGSFAVDSAANHDISLWYARDAIAGATTITPSGATVAAVVAWEFAGLRTDVPLDAVSKLENQPATATPLGAAVTTTQPGEAVVSVAIVAHAVTGIHAGNAFINDALTFTNGWGHLSSATAPAGIYQAAWDQDLSGTYCATSASFVVGP